MRSSMVGVRAGVESDRAAVVGVLLRGFEADPWSRWWFPSDEAWSERAPEFFGLGFDARMQGGGEIVVSEPMASVALWTPPGGNRHGADWVAQLWTDHASRFRDEELHRILVGEAALAEHALSEPHWHLGLLATDPDYRGRGFARAVLEPILRLATREEHPVSLETSATENVAFYSQFGFETRGETDLPDGGPHVWTLVRP